MKNIIRSIRITLTFCIFFTLCYVLILWLIARFATPNKGEAETIYSKSQQIGMTNAGQFFNKNIYFWGRPSHAGYGYDGTSSGGSNKGATDKAYLKEIKQHIDSFLVYHPYLTRKDIPAELVTSSGSGLDPNISPEAAFVQVRRVAQARGLSETYVYSIVKHAIEQPLFGFLGPQKVNIVRLNMAIDEAQKNASPY